MSLLVGNGFVNDLATRGVIYSIILGVLGVVALVAVFNDDLMTRARVVPGTLVLVLTGLAVLGVFGNTYKPNYAEIYRAEVQMAQAKYTKAFVLSARRADPERGFTAPICTSDVWTGGAHFDLNSKLPTTRLGNDWCSVTVDTASYHTLAYPYQEGQSALKDLETTWDPNNPFVLTLTYPLNDQFQVRIFFYDPKEANHPYPLPDWANSSLGCSGCLTANQSHPIHS